MICKFRFPNPFKKNRPPENINPTSTQSLEPPKKPNTKESFYSNEILMHIFQHADFTTLLQCARVCRVFNYQLRFSYRLLGLV